MSKTDANVNVTVTFRHTESTPALKAYAIEKISHCVKKYVQHDAEAQVILIVEKRDHIAEANVRSKNYDVTSKAVTEDLYSSIDKVVDTVETQLRKQKERATDHKH